MGGSPEWMRVSGNYLPRDGSKAMQGDLDMDTSWKIVNLSDPTDAATTLPGSITAPRDAINVGWADVRYVNTTGDTMTGNLTLNNSGVGNLYFGGDANDYITLDQADNTFKIFVNGGEEITLTSSNLTLGGTLTFNSGMAGNIDMNTNYIFDHATRFDYDSPGTATNTDVVNVLAAKDIVGNVGTTGTQTGLAVTFDNTNKQLDFDLTARIRLTGDITASYTNDSSGDFSIATTHTKVHDISEITNAPQISDDGAAYYDSRTDLVGTALKVVFGGTTAYIPANSVACGCTCTCTCTCTCQCTCDCAHSKCAKR